MTIRCVRPDQSSLTVALHLLESGEARLRLTINRGEYFVPFLILLRALSTQPMSDREVRNVETTRAPRVNYACATCKLRVRHV